MEYHIDLLIRERKSGAFSLRSFRCIDKPDSVESSHVSGMNVAIHLKRLFRQLQLVADEHGLAQK